MLNPPQAQRQVPGQRFIDPEVLTRIDNLELVARRVVDGFISGLQNETQILCHMFQGELYRKIILLQHITFQVEQAASQMAGQD